ncbi:MAG: hypothetical protein ACYC7F_05675 [Gemmatimonadaceae bacterium]
MAAMLTVTLLGGCGREPVTPEFPRRFGQQVLAGFVYAETGEPVVGANVRITGVTNGGLPSAPSRPAISVGGCSGPDWSVDSASTTSSDGRFARPIGFGPWPNSKCVAVEVTPPPGSPLRGGIAWVPEMRATSDTDVPDTTRVVLLLTRK